MQPVTDGVDVEQLGPAFRELAAFVVRTTGHTRLSAKIDLLFDKVRRRLELTGLGSFEAYLDLLKQMPQGKSELDSLIAELTIGETSFFRHPEQFDALRHQIIPDCLRRNNGTRQLRIWSAGCANGAEAYSIAILLDSILGSELAQWNVAIVGSDINRAFLAEAENGVYSDWTLRDVSAEHRANFFAQCGASWAIREKYKANVEFVQHNLVSDEFPSIRKNIFAFDIVMCRNVMIYFDEANNIRLAEQLDAVLVDHGWLFTGPTDFNTRLDDIFARERVAGTSVHRRRPRGEANAQHAAAVSAAADHNAARVGAGPVLVAARPRSNARQRTRNAAAPSGPAPSPPSVADIATVAVLANKGDWPGALQTCRSILETNSCNAPAHYYYALVQQHSGAVVEAEQALKRTIYLDRDFALAHYQLGLLRKDAHDLARCRQSFRNALAALGKLPDDSTISPCGQITALDLRELATHQLDLLGPP
jgi:chemotaxis protein methyltransferase CheR